MPKSPTIANFSFNETEEENELETSDSLGMISDSDESNDQTSNGYFKERKPKNAYLREQNVKIFEYIEDRETKELKEQLDNLEKTLECNINGIKNLFSTWEFD